MSYKFQVFIDKTKTLTTQCTYCKCQLSFFYDFHHQHILNSFLYLRATAGIVLFLPLLPTSY